MKFKDALLKIKKEGLLDCIVDESNDYEVCSSIEKEIDSLLSLEPQSSFIEHIVCVRFLKDELQMDENRHYIIESDVKYHVTYNVYAVHNNNLHSTLFMDLRKIVGTDILDSCIERYGFVTVMASILHELSNSGYAYSQRKEEINNALKITEKEILDQSESFISFDDFSESLGFSERSQEEIEFVQKAHQHVFNELEKEKRILGLNM
ncbi:hypothetical protein [Holdemanella biformis]|uniref:hypothetical protein n=1 Tax=Holdemanella biformis TaxID=1735 RepID=UPI0022E4AD9B|nr:hypothetical protein [Holdemanella biformis]